LIEEQGAGGGSGVKRRESQALGNKSQSFPPKNHKMNIPQGLDLIE